MNPVKMEYRPQPPDADGCIRGLLCSGGKIHTEKESDSVSAGSDEILVFGCVLFLERMLELVLQPAALLSYGKQLFGSKAGSGDPVK